MSLKHEDTFPCPRCGREQHFTIWRYLNIRDNPEELPGVLDGSVFDFTCSHCKVSVRVGYPLVYHDPDRKLLVVMTQDRNPEQVAIVLAQLKETDLFSPTMNGYILRGVTQPPELAEKVLISLENLDDRVIELYKAWIRTSYAAGHEGKEPSRILLVKSEVLQFLIFPEDGDNGMYGAEFQENAYRDAEKQMSAFFPKGLDDNLFVDEQWVAKLLTPGEALH